jgi:hypothetical protein
MVNYMHVRSSGNPFEIIGERENLAISCDLITRAVDILMNMCKPGIWMIIVRIQIVEIVQRRQAIQT